MSLDDFEIQPKLNRHVLRLMYEWGSDPEKTHKIDHHFLSRNRRGAEALLSWAKGRGFEVSDIHEENDNGESVYSFVVTISSIPDTEKLDRQTNQMLRSAIEHECEYDGWGALIEE